ncbi:hypothetical protein F5Y10DRAFT_293660 [Nemania abortiva]|nr:hypothetical protein F5Y10DRAFT_293660 [Nemania abortiva]
MHGVAAFVVAFAALTIIVDRLLPIMPDSFQRFVESMLAPPVDVRDTASSSTVTASTVTASIFTTSTVTASTSTVITTTTTITTTTSPTPTIDFAELFVNLTLPSRETDKDCDWSAVYSLGNNTRAPFKLITEGEANRLTNAASSARKSLLAIEPLIKSNPEQAREIPRDLLDHIALAPIRRGCEVVQDLQSQLTHYTVTDDWGNDTKEAVPLIDSAIAKLSRESEGLREGQAESDAPYTRVEREFFSAFERGVPKYCLGGDCGWPNLVIEARQTAETILGDLRERLEDVKSQVIDDDRRDWETLIRLWRQLRWMLPLYFVLLVVARLLAMGWLLAGNEVLEPRFVPASQRRQGGGNEAGNFWAFRVAGEDE